MALRAGEKLGPYEIVAPIGAGGMGEVYKALDTRLERVVALKVLPAHIAGRTEAVARFEREARAVASLNHPHICVLFDIGPGYMVMELIEGETLSSRIERGPIPLEPALVMAGQIADALDRAHRAGVTHRDVKPGNIMLTRDGVKVLDFGLAKSAGVMRSSDETLTKALTAEGTVMGTPQYMAPELFGGKEADARSDIWAFGAVLFEMVTGRKAFEGKSYSSLVGAILSADPGAMGVSRLDRLVRRCLAKDPEDRYQSMRDVVLDLRITEEARVVAGRPWGWVAAGVLAILGAAGWALRPVAATPRMYQISVNPPENAVFSPLFVTTGGSAVSPDGTMIAFTARTDGKDQLWVRRLDGLESRLLPETEDATQPFWSPDSAWIGFSTTSALKKIAVAGVRPQTLSTLSSRSGTWNQEGVILFRTDERRIYRISASGGTPVPLTDLKDRAWHPYFLPDGSHFLYLSRNDPAGIYFAALDDSGRGIRVVADVDSNAAFAGGQILFVRERSLMAQTMDAATGKTLGDPVQILERIGFFPNTAVGDFSVSATGTLVYGQGGNEKRTLVLRDRSGKKAGEFGGIYAYNSSLRLSLDGNLLAVSSTDEKAPGLWVVDRKRNIRSRLTTNRGHLSPTWSPDGSYLAFGTLGQGSQRGIHRIQMAGGGTEQLSSGPDRTHYPTSWSTDGKFLVFADTTPSGLQPDIKILPLDGDKKIYSFLETPFDELAASFSPDVRWIAYVSNQSGVGEVYAQRFIPGQAAGGAEPRWRRDGREIYCRSAGGALSNGVVD